MKKLLLFLSFAVLLLASCRKNDDTMFSGKVYDRNTGAVFPNAHILVTAYYHARSGGSEQYNVVGDGYTDGSGNFALLLADHESRQQVDKQYSVKVMSSPAWSFIDETRFGVVYHNGSVQHDVDVNGYGRVQVIVKNTSPYDQNDFIGNFYIGQPGEMTQSFSGTSVNDTLPVQYHSGTRLLHYTVVKNSVTAQYTDTLQIPGFAENYYEIDY